MPAERPGIGMRHQRCSARPGAAGLDGLLDRENMRRKVADTSVPARLVGVSRPIGLRPFEIVLRLGGKRAHGAAAQNEQPAHQSKRNDSPETQGHAASIPDEKLRRLARVAGTFLSVRGVHQLADDAAVGYPPARPAAGTQAGKLMLQRFKLPALHTHALELRIDEAVHFFARSAALAGEREQPAHVRKRHVEKPAMTDELQPLERLRSVAPISRRGARGWRKQPFPLVVANGRGIDARLAGQLSDFHAGLTLKWLQGFYYAP